MNFFELKDDQLFDSLADAIEPIVTIYESEKISKIMQEKNKKIVKAKVLVCILRDFKPEAKQILAAVNGVPVDKFECTFISMSTGIKEVLENKEIMSFFTSLIQTLHSFGAVMENTEEKEK